MIELFIVTHVQVCSEVKLGSLRGWLPVLEPVFRIDLGVVALSDSLDFLHEASLSSAAKAEARQDIQAEVDDELRKRDTAREPVRMIGGYKDPRRMLPWIIDRTLTREREKRGKNEDERVNRMFCLQNKKNKKEKKPEMDSPEGWKRFLFRHQMVLFPPVLSDVYTHHIRTHSYSISSSSSSISSFRFAPPLTHFLIFFSLALTRSMEKQKSCYPCWHFQSPCSGC